jgi:hypothetical protein
VRTAAWGLLAAYALELGLGGALLLWALCGGVGLVLSIFRGTAS